MDNWNTLTFPERDDIVLDRMAGRGIDPRRFDAPLHDLAGAWRDHVISRLRTPTRPCGADGSQERADTALRVLDMLCGALDLPPYSEGIDGDALDVAHAMMMQSYARR